MTKLAHQSALTQLLGAPAMIGGKGLAIAEARLAGQFIVNGFDEAAAIAAVAQATGLQLPFEPCGLVTGEPYGFWLAPKRWLIVATEGDRFALAAALADRCQGKAIAADVSDGLAAIDLEGPRATDLLAMGCAIDLSAEAFDVTRAVRSPIGQVPALIYRRPTGWRLHLDRSWLDHFWLWLEKAATAFV